MQDQGNSGRPGSTQSFSVGQGGFSPGQFAPGHLDVTAPLNVNAAPTAAMKLSQALSGFQQKTEMAFGRMAMEQSESDIRQGQADGGYKKDANGNYQFDYSTWEGKSKAFVQGAQRGAALKAAYAANTEFEQLRANDPTLMNADANTLHQRYDAFMAQKLGGMQNSALAREEVGPLIQHWQDQMAGDVLRKQLVEHQQEQIDGAVAKARTLVEGGQLDSEALLKNNLMPAIGNMREAQQAMIDIYGRIAVEKGDPRIMDALKQQSGSHFGQEANDRFDALYKQSQVVQSANLKDANETAMRSRMLTYQHNWNQNQPVPQKMLDEDLASHRLTWEQYHSLSDYNKGIGQKQDSYLAIDQTIQRLGYRDSLGQNIYDKQGNPHPITEDQQKEHLEQEHNRQFGMGNDQATQAERLVGNDRFQGALADLMDNQKVGIIDDRSLQPLKQGWQITNPKDVSAIAQVVNWIDDGHKSVAGQLGLTDQRWFELRAVAQAVNRGGNPQDIAAGYQNQDMVKERERVKDGAKALLQARDADSNPLISDKSWWNVLGFGTTRQNDLTPATANARKEFVGNVATQMWATGNFASPADAVSAANDYTIGRSVFFTDQNGKKNWAIKTDSNVDAQKLGEALSDFHSEIKSLIPAGENPTSYRLNRVPGDQEMYALTDQFGKPFKMANGNWSYFSAEALVKIHGDREDVRTSVSEKAQEAHDKAFNQYMADDYLEN